MSQKNSSIPEVFLQALQAELENNSEGVSEYDLMQSLKLQGYFDFLSVPALPHELFHAHFILFHGLYLLRDLFLKQKSSLLDIHTLKIQLSPYLIDDEGDNCLQKEDKLRAYYLDFNNLENTSEDDVYDMLASFWNKFDRFADRDAALAELGLKDPVDDKTKGQIFHGLPTNQHPAP